MEMNVDINKNISFLRFLDDISCWSYFCREGIREEWLKNENLSKKEEGLLKEFGEMRKKYSLNLVDNIFFLEDLKEITSELKRNLEIKDLERMKQIIKHFYPIYLSKVWDKKYETYKNLAEEVKKESRRLDGFLRDITKIFKSRVNKQTLYILVSPPGKEIGGTVVREDRIVLHITKETFDIDRLMSIIAHEIIHILLEKEGVIDITKNKIRDQRKAKIFSEGLATSFSGCGFFDKKYFNKQPKELYNTYKKYYGNSPVLEHIAVGLKFYPLSEKIIKNEELVMSNIEEYLKIFYQKVENKFI